jgi:hypothetical protein
MVLTKERPLLPPDLPFPLALYLVQLAEHPFLPRDTGSSGVIQMLIETLNSDGSNHVIDFSCDRWCIHNRVPKPIGKERPGARKMERSPLLP